MQLLIGHLLHQIREDDGAAFFYVHLLVLDNLQEYVPANRALHAQEEKLLPLGHHVYQGFPAHDDVVDFLLGSSHHKKKED